MEESVCGQNCWQKSASSTSFQSMNTQRCPQTPSPGLVGMHIAWAAWHSRDTVGNEVRLSDGGIKSFKFTTEACESFAGFQHRLRQVQLHPLRCGDSGPQCKWSVLYVKFTVQLYTMLMHDRPAVDLDEILQAGLLLALTRLNIFQYRGECGWSWTLRDMRYQAAVPMDTLLLITPNRQVSSCQSR